MKPHDDDMFELPVVVNVPPEATVIGPIDCAPLGKVMIMLTVDGSPQAETVQTWSSTTWLGAIEQPEPDVPVPPPPFPPLAARAAGTIASARTRATNVAAWAMRRVIVAASFRYGGGES